MLLQYVPMAHLAITNVVWKVVVTLLSHNATVQFSHRRKNSADREREKSFDCSLQEQRPISA